MKSAILRAFGRESQAAPWDNEESIREELFSIERLEQHAESLAAAQPIALGPTSGRSLAVRLKENESVLLDAYRATAGAVGEGRAITPAAEWLLDNYHLVEEQIREIRDDLPPGYYRQLPKLAAGPFTGYPRVFGIAWAFVAHTDSRFDPEMLRRFVRAYQRVQPLTIGELWAVAITLRIVLVENLRRGARRIVASRAARREADALADRLLGVNAPPVEAIAPTLQHYEEGPLPAAFAVQLVQRLRDQDPRVTPALLWLDERLAAQGTTADAIVHDEHQRQGATNVTVRNVITSMRLISDVDWAELVESVSLIDETLRPGSDFAAMDFPTRNLYRSAIEELARGSRLSELEIARAALAAAGDRALQKPEEGDDPDGPRRDPGYYLIAGGRRAFEGKVGFRAPMRSWAGRFGARIGIRGYIGGVMAVAAIMLALPLAVLAGDGIGGWWLAFLAVLGLIPSIDAAKAFVDRGDHGNVRRDDPAGPRAPRRRACAPSHGGRRPDPADDAGRAGRADRASGDPPPRELRKASFISHCSRTGPTPRRRPSTATTRSSTPPPRESPASIAATDRPPVGTAFSCSIAGASGTTVSGSGSGGNASAASSTN